MLKAIEVVGFKSFADKTRFEFPPGITVIVGPNGSGKSNVVDAIKWVLGEQSAKSLRGKEMADVIFKGTQGASGGRKPAGSASATIVLDNADRRLALDADEVLITRRVYRSGESEYQINGETCRLKDIRGLIRGTGVGVDAYSLIEQGKVERLLQASNKDRRAIFEEAAGISRFNAKKVEAQRRLVRVEQSLVRLRDIVDEVGGRYRSVKSQAAKAARYREYTRRLQELRTHVGLSDYRKYTQQLDQFLAQQTRIGEDHRAAKVAAEAAERQLQDCESTWTQLTCQLDDLQQKRSEARARITETESAISLNEIRSGELTERIPAMRLALDKLRQQTQESEARIQAHQQEFTEAESAYASCRSQLIAEETAIGEIEQLRGEAETRRAAAHQQRQGLTNSIAERGKKISGIHSQWSAGNESQRHLESESGRLSASVDRLEQQQKEAQDQQQKLSANVAAMDQDLAQQQQQAEQWKQRLAEEQAELQRLATEHAGLRHRAEVIEEVERRLEGINQGAKYILSKLQEPVAAPWNDVVGLVADLVQVNVEYAESIDIALGDLAQYVVVRGGNLIRGIADGKTEIAGRAGLIELESTRPLRTGTKISLAGYGGVIGRADQLVQFEPAYEDLMRRLLGTTWIVKRLSDALHLHEQHPLELRFVTLDGDIVEYDGSVLLGARQVSAGIVSRRSELRAIHRELERLARRSDEQRLAIQQSEGEIQQRAAAIKELFSQHTETSKLLARQEDLAEIARQQWVQVAGSLQECQQRLEQVQRQNAELQKLLTSERSQLETQETELAEIGRQIESLDELQKNQDAALEQRRRQVTTLKVQLAKFDQRLQALRESLQQDQGQQADRLEQTRDRRGQLAQSLWSLRSATRSIQARQAELQTQRALQDRLQAELEQSERQRHELDAERGELREQSRQLGQQLQSLSDQNHQTSMALEKLNLERDQLALRLKEDYQIDLVELSQQEETDQQQAAREEIEAEIADLRQKLGSIGSVNMDALSELDDLESRYNALDTQYSDLAAAKETLEKIIHRINNESRRLFLETLNAIRTNFQQLFRQTFGGGRADIVLEEGVDILDAGVEIVATPPGKPEFNNSLLSGGEKALTAVSLLMAIFKFRPSPFCVLDEVDAPFDEANIGRFIDVLRSFLGWTKFVIVTHSKKTMTAATTLYGVTMQESGISKRVSVRFEDVGEDGHIERVREDENGDDSEQRGVA